MPYTDCPQCKTVVRLRLPDDVSEKGQQRTTPFVLNGRLVVGCYICRTIFFLADDDLTKEEAEPFFLADSLMTFLR
jgi:hypothetical protein